MNDVFINIVDKNDLITRHFNKVIVSVEDILSTIEDLTFEIEELKEQLKEIKSKKEYYDVHDAYDLYQDERM